MIELNLNKMHTEIGAEILYSFKHNDQYIIINDWIGKKITLRFDGKINCSKCGKITKNSFGEGFCYTCFISAPEAAECIIRPELCKAHLGEGRDVLWEEEHHNQPHVVYLAASDIVKVGVTRTTQIPTRWIDQGASSAIVLAVTPNRYEAGKLEVALKSEFADKTNWRKMLSNVLDETIDLEEEKWSLHERLPSDLTEFFSEDDTIWSLNFPVQQYPTKVTSVSFDKFPEIAGVLKGIKGQYFLFEDGRVLNIRKHTGYLVQIEV
ncbi:MAG: DUF2797 domain-containing protein [Bacteroidetes bacterium]|nr:DUF2797 domain-containing protein [Bacteroidota bacterium]